MEDSGNPHNKPTGIRQSLDSKGVTEIHGNKVVDYGNPHNKPNGIQKSSNSNRVTEIHRNKMAVLEILIKN